MAVCSISRDGGQNEDVQVWKSITSMQWYIDPTHCSQETELHGQGGVKASRQCFSPRTPPAGSEIKDRIHGRSTR